MYSALFYLLSVLICSDSLTVYQIHPESWGMTARRHSAPLTSDLQRYSTRPRPGLENNPARATSRTPVCHPRENSCQTQTICGQRRVSAGLRAVLFYRSFLSPSPNVAVNKGYRCGSKACKDGVSTTDRNCTAAHALNWKHTFAPKKSNPKTKLQLPVTSPYFDWNHQLPGV